ncbi:MAG: hypothetical protein ACP5HS_09300 [Anaerolineae bacterium]
MTDKPHAPNTHTRLARLASTGSFLSAGLAAWLYIKPRTRGLASNMVGYGLKILAAAFSPLISLMGLLGAMGARRTQQRFAALAGGVGALLAAHYVKRVTEPHDGFERAYGSGKGTANPITAAPNDASSPAERQSTVGAASETPPGHPIPDAALAVETGPGLDPTQTHDDQGLGLCRGARRRTPPALRSVAAVRGGAQVWVGRHLPPWRLMAGL